MQKTIWLTVIIALTAFACTQAPPRPPAPTERQIAFEPQRFIFLTSDLSSVEGLHQFDLAFDTRTGRICKTWKWTLEGDTALNSIPECYEMLREQAKEMQKAAEEAAGRIKPGGSNSSK